MFAFDTNYLVRHLVADDPAQAKTVTDTMVSEIAAGNAILLPDIVLCETVWVLQRALDVPKAALLEMLKAILEDTAFCFEDEEILHAAVSRYELGKADFADYLIAEHAHQHDCQLLSFDKQLMQELAG